MSTAAKNIGLMELIKSEQRFVDDMKTISKDFIQPLIESKMFSSSQIDALFVNWPSLTRTHEKFVNALKIDETKISIGKIFLQFLPEFFIEYETYFRFHCAAMKCFRDELLTSAEFRSFMNERKRQTSGIGSLGDANILTLPLQRLSKYPFLISQILKETSEENSDRIDLETSLDKTNELRATINNVIDEEIHRMKFDWLEKHVDSTKLNDDFIFNSLTHFGDQRQLIHYGQIRLSNGNLLNAMLFNDYLLLTRRKNRFLRKIRRFFHRSSIVIVDWFDDDQLDLIVFKKPIFLHEIRNVRMIDEETNGFQFDYRGRQMNFFTENFNQRFLWIKYLNETIDYCRRQLLCTSMFRAPQFNEENIRPKAKLILQTIRANNLPNPFHCQSSSLTWNSYCIIEMNHGQRQTTDVLWDSTELQWKISFRFSIFHFDHDRLKCSIYNRAKYTTDRLLGSIELPIGSLIDRQHSFQDDFSSIYSLTTISHQTDVSLQRSFELEHSSNNSLLFIQYVYELLEEVID